MSGVPALILGGGVTALGALRALGRRGVPTFVVADPPGAIRFSRWYRRPPLSVRGGAHFAADLAALPWERAVLVPCSDAWALAVAGLPADTTRRFPASVADRAVLEGLVDKGGLAELTRSLGIPHPDTRLVAEPSGLDALPPGLLARAFLKPRDSQRFVARFGVKAFRVRDREEAQRKVREIAAAGCEVLVQEYIPGPADRHYFVDGFASAGGRLEATFVRRRLRMYPADFGDSSYMVSVAPEEAAPAVSAVTRLLAHVGYRGIFSAEFKWDERDGAFKLLEVNVRPWWYVEFAVRCGVDVCALAYLDALGEPLEPLRAYQVGRRCAYPYYDFFACRELRRRGELTLARWLADWLSAEQPVLRWDDPAPGLAAGAAWLWTHAAGRSAGRTRG